MLNLFRKSAQHLEEGQEWEYRARPGEEASTVIIERIDRAGVGVLVHVSVTNLRISNPHAQGGAAEQIAHLALTEAALRKSVVRLKGKASPLKDFESGYREWFDGTDGEGAFDITLAEVVATVEGLLLGAAT